MNKHTIFKPVSFANDKTTYIAPSWQDMGELTFLLAKKIIKKQKKFDRLITLAKGGWTWSRTMADYLHIEEIGSIQIKLYTGIFETQKTPTIIQSLPVPVANERLLVFDDVADSGETLLAVKKYLKLCGAKSIVTAVLFYKSWAKHVPDFYAAKTNSWIVFPHEIRESIVLLSQKWHKNKLSRAKIMQRLKKINLPEDQIKYFLHKKNSFSFC